MTFTRWDAVGLALVVTTVAFAGIPHLSAPPPEVLILEEGTEVLEVELDPGKWSEVVKIAEGTEAQVVGRFGHRANAAVFPADADLDSRPEPAQAAYGALEWEFTMVGPSVLVVDNSPSQEPLAAVVSVSVE